MVALSRQSSILLIVAILGLRGIERLVGISSPSSAPSTEHFLSPVAVRNIARVGPLPLRPHSGGASSTEVHATAPPAFVSEPAAMTDAPSASSATHAPRHMLSLPRNEAAAIWRPVVGRWLASHVGRRPSSRPAPPLPGCPGGCGADGSCNAVLGECSCSSGSTGTACGRREHWECNAADGRYMWSRCAGACDRSRGYCYCGERGTYPGRQLVQCEPIGIEGVIRPWQVDPKNAAERFPWRAIWGRGDEPPGGAVAPLAPASKADPAASKKPPVAWCEAE